MRQIKIIVAIVCCLMAYKSYSQDLGTTSKKRFELGAYYPVLLGDNVTNRFNTLYDGVVGIDAKVTIKKLPFINIKLGSTFDYFKLSDDHVAKGSSLRVNPNAMVGLDLSKFIRLEPYVGIGYSFIFDNGEFRSSSDSGIIVINPGDPTFDNGGQSYSESDDNLFYKIGVNYKISRLFYVDTHVYLAKLFDKSDIEEVSNQQEIALNIGLGIYF